jgi:hypothetical protein
LKEISHSPAALLFKTAFLTQKQGALTTIFNKFKKIQKYSKFLLFQPEKKVSFWDVSGPIQA